MSQKEAELEVLKMELQELNLWFVEHGWNPRMREAKLKKARRKMEIERCLPKLKREVGEERESNLSSRADKVFTLANLDPTDPIQCLRAAFAALCSLAKRTELTRDEQAVLDALRGYF